MPKDEFRFKCALSGFAGPIATLKGIVFNGAYFDYLEVAQAEYFRNLGFILYDPDGRRHFDTATVKATLEYISPGQGGRLNRNPLEGRAHRQ